MSDIEVQDNFLDTESYFQTIRDYVLDYSAKNAVVSKFQLVHERCC